jgi:hypothetical protein
VKKEEGVKLILSELDYFLNCVSVDSPETEITYYLSALHPMVNRVLNICYDRRFVYLHEILAHLHNSISIAVVSLMKGENPPRITKLHFDVMFTLINDLKNAISNDFESVHDVYEKLIELAYSTVGNGSYLYKKGMLNLP